MRLIEHVGENPAREGLRDTPARVVRALEELTSGYQANPAEILGTTFEETMAEPVIIRGIPFASLCEHHLLPFNGRVSIGYIPNGRVVGLSKLPRLVQCFARRLQLQERLTREIAHAIHEHLQPLGVAVVVDAEHLCMQMRGIRSEGRMTTSQFLGQFQHEQRRREFFDQTQAA